jgi:hypothetical protein
MVSVEKEVIVGSLETDGMMYPVNDVLAWLPWYLSHDASHAAKI